MKNTFFTPFVDIMHHDPDRELDDVDDHDGNDDYNAFGLIFLLIEADQI